MCPKTPYSAAGAGLKGRGERVKLFGTDGIRGIANDFLNGPLALRVGGAAAALADSGPVAVGMDTRRSSEMLAMALAAGACGAGRDVIMLGVVPTPAVAYLAGLYGCGVGVMISASHNPPEYNGIKLFTGDGLKLTEALESRVEALVAEEKPPVGEKCGRVRDACEAARRDYIDHLRGCCDVRLDGLRVAVDCANGAAAVTARELFTSLGAQAHMLGCNAESGSINVGCGTMHMEHISEYVVANRLDCGVAFDGDADRCLFTDETGALVDGDMIMAICAADMRKREGLRSVVGTAMSNMGLVRFCAEQGIEFEATDVGDRHVLERMLRDGCPLGGEQSGHIIFLRHAPTGDGQLTALKLLSIMRREGLPLSRLASVMRRYPQQTLNVRISAAGKSGLRDDGEIARAVARARARLGGEGRLLVRPSGTEPVIRVTAEGEDPAAVKQAVEDVARTIRKRLACPETDSGT